MRPVWLALLVLSTLATPLPALGQGGNLLRNGRFQDDWLTLLPENKNHNWNYSTDFYHRRDYNPDGWTLKGGWQWADADASWGQRRLVLQGPESRITQSVNWGAIHDPRKLAGFPDAGGYPTQVSPSSKRPERLVRDLLLRVRLKGQDVAANAGAIELGLGSAKAKALVPAGTFDNQWLEAKLPAAEWLKNVKKDVEVELPAFADVAIHYQAALGRIEVAEAWLGAAPPPSPNLLANGGFDVLDRDGYPLGWSRQQKYRYFPPGYYYMFRTKIAVAGLKAGTKVRVLFEDRELTAAEGHFVDDFRGTDLYQRYGGGPYTGYGDTPVALHVYELPTP